MRAWLTMLAAVAVSFGCEQAQDQTAANVVERYLESKGREAQVEVDRDEGKITVTLGDAIVPPGWPKGIPVPPGARRLRVESSAPDGKTLSVSTEAGGEGLEKWYRRELERDGWRVETTGDGAFRATRGGRRLAAAFTRDGDRMRARLDLEGNGERGG